jgi:hypothetical protein
MQNIPMHLANHVLEPVAFRLAWRRQDQHKRKNRLSSNRWAMFSHFDEIACAIVIKMGHSLSSYIVFRANLPSGVSTHGLGFLPALHWAGFG